jgi:serine/threonine protein kinase
MDTSTDHAGVYVHMSCNVLPEEYKKHPRILGKGSHGSVYEGSNRSGEKVAIKVIPKSDEYPFIEASIHEKCSGHPNVCEYLGTYEDEKNYYIVMELVEGLTLKKFLSQNKFSSSNMLVYLMIICQLISAIAHLHKNRIFHADIKLANVIVVQNFDGTVTVKLIDFGLSSSFESIEQFVLGTPFYFSPEIANETGIDKKSDIWALGILILAILTGEEKPWFLTIVKNQRELLNILKNLDFSKMQFPTNLTENKDSNIIFLTNVVKKCLSLDKTKRPSAKFLEILLNIMYLVCKIIKK